jgi:hypothetical protein
MTKQAYIKFEWEGSSNSDDKSGVATFSYSDYQVNIKMDDFKEVAKLSSMIDLALYRCRVDTLDSVETNITDLLHKKRYE